VNFMGNLHYGPFQGSNEARNDMIEKNLNQIDRALHEFKNLLGSIVSGERNP